jgi:Ser/Thr protein kinase RdoA (MazF antagonist)
VPAEYGDALERLHAGMRQLDVPAPHFTDRVEQAEAIVHDRAQSPQLGDVDRELLSTTLQTFRSTIVDRGREVQLLHGEPHVGNVLSTTSGLRFIDLETCCYGPVEFDVAHAPDDVGSHYAPADPLLLRDCRILTLAMVASWRSDRGDHYPDGHQALTELLGLIRQGLDQRGIDTV